MLVEDGILSTNHQACISTQNLAVTKLQHENIEAIVAKNW